MFGRLALVLLGALLAALLLAASSASAATPVFVRSFSDPNLIPGRIAVNEATGDVYVLNLKTSKVDWFNKSGELKEEELSAPLGLGLEPGGRTDSIAVDNSGGEHEGAVYVGGKEDLATAFDANGEVEWQHVFPKGGARGVAVDPSGGVWFDHHKGSGPPAGIVRLDAVTGEPTEDLIPGVEGGALAFDRAGDLYLAGESQGIAVFKFAPPIISSVPTEIGATVDETEHTIGLEAIDLATEAGSEDLYVVHGNSEGGGPEVLRFTSTGASLPPFKAAEEVEFRAIAVDSKDKLIYLADSENNVEVWSSDLVPFAVNVTGGGSVQCETEGAGSFGPCSAAYKEGEVLNLKASSSAGSMFAGWLGCKHTGANTCQVTIGESAQEITAVFLHEGVEGKAGKEGASGAGGAAGPGGAQGPAGAAGKSGAAGPQGPAGAQGPAGPTGKVTCKVAPAKHGKVKVACTVKAAAAAASVHWRLTHGGRTIRRGSTRGAVSLSRLHRGRYRLYLQGTAGFTSIVIA
jgi:hypothetical protein